MATFVKINTAHNVDLELQIANVGQRIGAYILDGLIKVGYILTIIAVMSILGVIGEFGDVVWVTVFMVFLFIPLIIYTPLFEKYFDGQTPGKKYVGIKVSSLDGYQLSTGQIFLRWLFRLVDFHLIYGLVAILVIVIRDKGQRVGDIVANTCVIDINKAKRKMYSVQNNLIEDHSIKYPEVELLETKDIRLIEDVLANRSENRFSIITKLSDKLQNKLLIQKEGNSVEFLQQLLNDYRKGELKKYRDLDID